jgi:glycerol uptake facilitator-like aquaporin
MVITWITLGSLTARALGSHALIPALAGNALGAVAGAVVLWFTETRIFSSDRRWALLAQTVTSFAEHVHLIRRQTAEIVAQ